MNSSELNDFGEYNQNLVSFVWVLLTSCFVFISLCGSPGFLQDLPNSVRSRLVSVVYNITHIQHMFGVLSISVCHVL